MKRVLSILLSLVLVLGAVTVGGVSASALLPSAEVSTGDPRPSVPQKGYAEHKTEYS